MNIAFEGKGSLVDHSTGLSTSAHASSKYDFASNFKAFLLRIDHRQKEYGNDEGRALAVEEFVRRSFYDSSFRRSLRSSKAQRKNQALQNFAQKANFFLRRIASLPEADFNREELLAQFAINIRNQFPTRLLDWRDPNYDFFSRTNLIFNPHYITNFTSFNGPLFVSPSPEEADRAKASQIFSQDELEQLRDSDYVVFKASFARDARGLTITGGRSITEGISVFDPETINNDAEKYGVDSVDLKESVKLHEFAHKAFARIFPDDISITDTNGNSYTKEEVSEFIAWTASSLIASDFVMAFFQDDTRAKPAEYALVNDFIAEFGSQGDLASAMLEKTQDLLTQIRQEPRRAQDTLSLRLRNWGGRVGKMLVN